MSRRFAPPRWPALRKVAPPGVALLGVALLGVALVLGACASTAPTPASNERRYIADLATLADEVADVLAAMQAQITEAGPEGDDRYVIRATRRNNYARGGTGGDAEAFEVTVYLDRVAPLETHLRIEPSRAVAYGSNQGRQTIDRFFKLLDARDLVVKDT